MLIQTSPKQTSNLTPNSRKPEQAPGPYLPTLGDDIIHFSSATRAMLGTNSGSKELSLASTPNTQRWVVDWVECAAKELKSSENLKFPLLGNMI